MPAALLNGLVKVRECYFSGTALWQTLCLQWRPWSVESTVAPILVATSLHWPRFVFHWPTGIPHGQCGHRASNLPDLRLVFVAWSNWKYYYSPNPHDFLDGLLPATPSQGHIDPLSPNINMHILLSVVHTFLMVQLKRICTNGKSFYFWWSFPLFSWPVCLIE